MIIIHNIIYYIYFIVIKNVYVYYSNPQYDIYIYIYIIMILIVIQNIIIDTNNNNSVK